MTALYHQMVGMMPSTMKPYFSSKITPEYRARKARETLDKSIKDAQSVYFNTLSDVTKVFIDLSRNLSK